MEMTQTLISGIALIVGGGIIYAIFQYFLVVRRSNEHGVVIVRGFFDWASLGLVGIFGRIVASLVTLAGFGLVGLHFIGLDIVGENMASRSQAAPLNVGEIASGATHFAVQTDSERLSRVVFGVAGESNALEDGYAEFPFGTCIVAEPSRLSVLNVIAAPDVSSPAWAMASMFAPLDALVRCDEAGMAEVIVPPIMLEDWRATHRISTQDIALKEGPHAAFSSVQGPVSGDCVMLSEIDTPNWVLVTYIQGDEIFYGFMRDSRVPFTAVTSADSC